MIIAQTENDIFTKYYILTTITILIIKINIQKCYRKLFCHNNDINISHKRNGNVNDHRNYTDNELMIIIKTIVILIGIICTDNGLLKDNAMKKCDDIKNVKP